MEIITTHLNADFDGLASMIAASKIYPDAKMAFPGSQEKNLRDFISQSLGYKYDFLKLKHIDISKITKLIVVDTRINDRIGVLSECLNNPNISIHLYDHHPDNNRDINGSLEIIEEVGATTTIFVEELQKKNIQISPEEATIFALGIYEDTGSLVHLTTTARDLQACAWLVDQGAKLDIVNQFISYDLTSRQINLLHELIKNCKRYTIQSIPIVVGTMSLPTYIDDFSLIVKRLMVMENLDNIFVLVSMAGRIYLICRSRITEVDVGKIARSLGGGGHKNAAAATIQDMTLIEAEEKLIASLHAHIQPESIARELMSSPAIFIKYDTSITEARELLTRYNITAAPVKHNGEVSGIISRRLVEKAIHHNLGNLSVGEYMITDIEILSQDATMGDLQKLVIEKHQRLVPINHESKIIGVITRTDLLNHLINDSGLLPQEMLNNQELPSLEKNRNCQQLIIENLSKDITVLLRSIGEISWELGCKSFVVGGFVRDLLLKHDNLDIDIVVEGDGIKIAKEIAKRLNGRIKTHKRFSTATITLPDYAGGIKVDIATARLEYYEYPAALPVIELSSIKLDLYRRDFTINAMAIHLNPDEFGTLVDFFNCQNDLRNKAIKVLHNLSFVEDPTRIFRAIRFEKRLGFKIVKHTYRLILNAVKMGLFDHGSDPRFFSELKIILSEENPLPAIRRIEEFNLFQFLWPDLKPHLKIDRRFKHRLIQAQRAISWYKLLYTEQKYQPWLIYLLVIMGKSTTKEVENFCKRFNLPPRDQNELITQKENADKTERILHQRKQLQNSEIYHLLNKFSINGLLYMMAMAQKTKTKKYISLFVTNLQYVRPKLTGGDLIKMGYKPGPQFKTMLDKLTCAKLDDKVQNIDDERKYILTINN